MQEGAAKGEYPGAVLIIGRHGKIAYAQTFGAMNPDTKMPMREEAIFRIASMTKPLASLAVMLLSEEGKLSIVDPVKRLYAEARVGDRSVNSDQWIARLAKMPLLFQPGTTWEYGASVDVLSVIVERDGLRAFFAVFAESR